MLGEILMLGEFLSLLFCFYFCFFKTAPPLPDPVDLALLEHQEILLALPPKCWD